MQLNDIVAQPSDYLQVIKSNALFQKDQTVAFTRPLTHLLQLKQRIFLNEKRLKVEKPQQSPILRTILRHLSSHWLFFRPQFPVILLAELENKSDSRWFVQASHHSIGKQVSD
jgi:hypothetical protein